MIIYIIYKKIKFINGRFVIILGKSLLILYFLQIHWFYFLGSNNRQQTIDEENPQTHVHQLLSHIDKENYRDGVYIFGRNVQDKNNSLKLKSSFSLFLRNKILIC